MDTVMIGNFLKIESIPLTQEDFTLDRVEREDGHEDYWFKTSNKADDYLTWRYMSQGCEHVFEVVYSKDENIVGIKRQYKFNWDVVISPNLQLKSILIGLIGE